MKLSINTREKRLELRDVSAPQKSEVRKLFSHDWVKAFYYAPITEETLNAAIALGAKLSSVESVKFDLYQEMMGIDQVEKSGSTTNCEGVSNPDAQLPSDQPVELDDSGQDNEQNSIVRNEGASNQVEDLRARWSLEPDESDQHPEPESTVSGEVEEYPPEELTTNQTSKFEVGDLVKSPGFEGIGKIVSNNPSNSTCSVAFFESPIMSEARIIEVDSGLLESAKLYDEQIIYCVHPAHKLWTRARYGDKHPDGSHLVTFIQGENVNLSLAEIYVPNLEKGEFPNPLDYLAARATDSYSLNNLRLPFIKSYTTQRAACRSISSIPSSSVELEAHQLAVVRRVLQDPVQRYLLADEVGLGKTIEAGLLIREHILDKGVDARVIVTCPEGLVHQWQKELSEKFHLESWMSEDWESISILYVCSFEEFGELECSNSVFTLVVVDEAHQISPLAWSESDSARSKYLNIAHVCNASHSCLLLSGTPLLGNEKNYLGMLHCLSPEAFPITAVGTQRFSQLIANRELVGGIFSALTPDNDDEMLEEICEELLEEFSNDTVLKALIENLLASFKVSDELVTTRDDAINELKLHIGNNFQVFHRLLRNRRVDPNVSILFPGLAGLTTVEWGSQATERGLDDLLEEYRDLANLEPGSYSQFQNYLSWLDLYFESPSSVVRYAEKVISDAKSESEANILQNIVFAGREEESTKLSKLASAVDLWLNDHPDGKVVIFCGSTPVAIEVNDHLEKFLRAEICLHNPSDSIEFNDQASARVFICDQRGEDGLNLHGKRRLAIHYGLPRSLARIEQRNGRLNRYASRIKGARKVEAMVLVPDYRGILADWVTQLDEYVGLFDDTVASLQFVLEEHFSQVWSKIERGDYQEIFQESALYLGGPDGALQREKNRVINLEQLNSLEAEVQSASSFAEQIVKQDEEARGNAIKLLGWITKGLLFNQRRVEENIFTLQFSNRTRLDAKSFIKHCLEGLDLQNSDYRNPKSHPMSFDRKAAVSAGHVYPFRFGQPFVDTIWSFSIQDPRAISTAFLRVADEFQAPGLSLYFKLSWLVEAVDSNQPRWKRRQGDDWLKPGIKTLWLDEFGNTIDPETKFILSKPHAKRGNGYMDLNLSDQKWSLVREWGGESKWKEVVQSLGDISTSILKATISQDLDSKPKELEGAPNLQLVSANAFFLASSRWLIDLRSRVIRG